MKNRFLKLWHQDGTRSVMASVLSILVGLIAGLQMTNLTAYNEYITDVIIAVIVYLSAFSLLIKTLLGHHRAHKTEAPLKDPGPDDSDSKAEGKEAAKA